MSDKKCCFTCKYYMPLGMVIRCVCAGCMRDGVCTMWEPLEVKAYEN